GRSCLTVARPCAHGTDEALRPSPAPFLCALRFFGFELLIFGPGSKAIVLVGYHQQMGAHFLSVRGPGLLAQLARLGAIVYRIHSAPLDAHENGPSCAHFYGPSKCAV